ncbi:nitroreductase family protein [Ancylobacter sp. A5.8]|uniref:nitroreductase family protein n=1 Tax=Ancylobacter gelatini TaxID=2919920 RepID=UPI001F4D5F46|nr:nitroreductase family protein [Ancylobacter gelatini]MCJ8144248.1 nitroreductase family protein [Ancylobacter gelatini]
MIQSPDAASRSEEALALMERRRSVAAAGLIEPGPTPEEMDRLLAVAARVPDHAILTPWRFIVIADVARAELGALLAGAYRAGNPEMEPAKREKFAGIMSRLFPAPVAVVVVSRPNRETMIPPMEQELSAGAVCMNLLHGANTLGFHGIWVTGWAANNPEALRLLGLGEGERVAGIVHLGTAREVPPERPRPDLAALVTRWRAPERV